MSPRPLDPKRRRALIEVAARLLAEQGPAALTARRVSEEVGCSTMCVYTHFGGMAGLVRQIVRDGFTQLKGHFRRVPRTDDPVTDMAELARAYRYNAHCHPNLYRIMFAGNSRDKAFSLRPEDRLFGLSALFMVAERAELCIAAGRFRPGDAGLVAHQIWAATHGLVTLELEGYIGTPEEADRCFDAQLVSLLHGLGDSLPAAQDSVAASARRFRAGLDGGPYGGEGSTAQAVAAPTGPADRPGRDTPGISRRRWPRR